MTKNRAAKQAARALAAATGQTYAAARRSAADDSAPTTGGLDVSLLTPDGAIAFGTTLDGGPVVFDPQSDSHLLVAGRPGSGKTSALRLFVAGLLLSGDEVRVIDTRGDLAFAEPWVSAYDRGAAAALVIREVADEVERRNSTLDASNTARPAPSQFRPLTLVVDDTDGAPAESDEDRLDKQFNLRHILRLGSRVGIRVIASASRHARQAIHWNAPGAPSRLLLGHLSSPDRRDLLKDTTATTTKDMPQGSGLYETGSGAAVRVNCRFIDPAELAAHLRDRKLQAGEPDGRSFGILLSDWSPVSGGAIEALEVLRAAGDDAARAALAINKALAAGSPRWKRSDGSPAEAHDVEYAGRSADGQALWSFSVAGGFCSKHGQPGFYLRRKVAPWLTKVFGLPVMTDPRANGYAGRLIIGDLDGAELVAGGHFTTDLVAELRDDEHWSKVWDQVSVVRRNPPQPQHNLRRTITVGDVQVDYQAFVLRIGQDPGKLVSRDVERSLASALALDATEPARFVHVDYFPDGSNGDRHPMAVVVMHSRDRLPSPGEIPGSLSHDDARDILGSLVAQACRAVGLPSPTAVKAVRTGGSWQVTLRLYDGLTPQRLAAAEPELGAVLRCAVEETPGEVGPGYAVLTLS